MTLYTIVPYELIFPVEESFNLQQENVYYQGVLVTVERVLPHRYKIISISSTDPNDYLKDELSPGKFIDLL